jgi:hypothetical protein
MATYFIPAGIPVKFDVSGDPAASYIVRAFLANTSTPATMYASAAGTSAGTTITLDSEGYIVTSGTRHPLWLDAAYSYDIQLRDPTNTTTVIAFDDISSGSASEINRNVNHNTIALARADTSLSSLIGTKSTVTVKEYATGYGIINAIYDVVAAGTGTDDGFECHDSTGAAVGLFQLKLRVPREIDIQLAGAPLNGTDDDSAYIETICDWATSGAYIVARKKGATCRLSRVDIINPNITIDFDRSITLKRYGSAGASERGMFTISNLLNANFKLICGTVDLNAEGCREIGVAGRIANTYAEQTTPPIKAISGPANSIFYGLRCSEVSIQADVIKNSSEVGILYRNSAGLRLDIGRMENFGNGAIELNFPEPAADGGTGTVPDFDTYIINVGDFRYIDDFGLGSGNGTALLVGGGQADDPAISNLVFNGRMLECLRDCHVEFNGGGYLDGFRIEYTSRDSQQGSLGLVYARNGTAKITAVRPGGPGSGALNSNWPEIYGAVVSAGCANVQIDARINDDRDQIIVTGADGAITAGDKTFTSATASFVAGDVGKFIAWEDGCASDVIFSTKIASINSSTSVEVELNAPATVSGKNYAYGGTTRTGIKISSPVSVDIVNSFIVAGKKSGLASEPSGVGIDITNPSVSARILNTSIRAPTLTGGSATSGLKVTSISANTLTWNDVDITGFTDNWDNIHTSRATMRQTPVIKLAQRADPSATLNTYGTEIQFSPNRNHINMVGSASLESTGISAETLTGQIIFYFYDGTSNTLDIAHASDQTTDLSAQQLATLHVSGCPIRLIGFKVKSSKNSSVAYHRITIVAVGD